jgi:hypothetical protein
VRVDDDEMTELKRRLLETEAQMSRILQAMEAVQQKVGATTSAVASANAVCRLVLLLHYNRMDTCTAVGNRAVEQLIGRTSRLEFCFNKALKQSVYEKVQALFID